ncbi:serine hydrolase [Levilactobacillus yonginensis]|uniref:serine hydrolase n=1 Tax=Levilactobacillus yonginensis TaxID=1054041 RepID=UPI00345D20DF
MRRLKLGLLVLLLASLLWPAIGVQAKAKTAQPATIQKMIKRDMRAAHGRWSVKVTRLGKQPLSVTTGNQRVRGQRSASTIKVFVMLTVFKRVQQHKLTLTAATKTDLKRMIHNSDNAATNRLIHKLGGFKRVNQTMKQYGFTHSHLRRYMMDTRALAKGHDNYTSVADLTQFLSETYRHQLLGKTYDNRMLTLLRHCRNHSKLPKLVKHATVFNKTGEYPDKGVQNDASLFRTKHGVYTIVVMAQQGNQAQQYRGMNRLGRDVVTYLNGHRG